MKHVGPISGVAAFQSRWVATAGYDNQVILWDTDSGCAIARSCHDHLVNHCSFSPSGELLVTASSDYSARIWSLPDLRLKAILGSHNDDVEMATFSPSGCRVATCSRDCSAAVFDIRGHLLTRLLGHEADVISIAWSLNEDIITTSDDGTIRRWNSHTGQQISVVDMDGVEIDAIAIDATGTIFAGDDMGCITVIRDGVEKKVQAHDAGIKRLVLDSSGSRIASLSYDRRMIIWRIEHDEGISQVLTTNIPSLVWPRSATFIDDAMAFGSFGSTYVVFDSTTGEWHTDRVECDRSINAVVHFEGDTYSVGDAGVVFKNGESITELGSLCNFLLPVGDTILTGGQMGIVFDALSGKTVHQHHSPLNCGVAYTVNGDERAIIGTYTGEGLVFHISSEFPEHLSTVKLHNNAVKGVSYSNGKIFSVCANRDAILVWADSLEVIEECPKAHDRIANGCVGIPDGRFASVSRDLKLRLWDGAKCEILETPHSHSIKCITISRDGRLLATGSYGGEVAIYDFSGGNWESITRPTATGVSSICPAEEPGRFLASAYDGQVYEVSADRRSRPGTL